MKQSPRIHYTESQKALMSERWRQGDSLEVIAQLFGRNHPSIQRIFAATTMRARIHAHRKETVSWRGRGRRRTAFVAEMAGDGIDRPMVPRGGVPEFWLNFGETLAKLWRKRGLSWTFADRSDFVTH
jgi:hypothetical protein